MAAEQAGIRSMPAMRRALLAHYDRTKRDLPWRRTSDPYAILVSEVMLQQTRVDTVVAYFERWMARFPTLEALAAASEDDVVAAWSGLGYYRRARNLHAAAKQVVAANGGVAQRPRGLPASRDGLLALPGIGIYTSAAIASIAFGEPVAVVDGNVERVVARVLGLRGDVKRKPTAGAIARAAQTWLDTRRPGDWNQAVMDLGATVCLPARPACARCPLSPDCAARRDDATTRIPRIAKARRPLVEPRHVVVVQDGGRLLLVRRGPGLLASTWGFLEVQGKGSKGSAGPGLRAAATRAGGLTLRGVREVGHVRHVFSHRIWSATVFVAQREAASRARQNERSSRPSPAADKPGHGDIRWVGQDQLAGMGLSAFDRKVLDIVFPKA